MTRTLNDLILQTKDTHLPAIVYHDGGEPVTLSHADISTTSTQISETLISLSLDYYEGFTVGLVVHKCHYLVPALAVGVLKSKGAFMYLDPTLPANQQNNLLARSKALFIITDSEDELQGWEVTAKCKLLGHALRILRETKQSKSIPDLLPDEWKIAYLVHTSGSTGDPKIVRVPHSCIVPNIVDLREIFDIRQSDVIFGTSPFSFDPSIIDMFLALSAGAKLILVESSIKSMPLKVAEIIRREKVTFIQSTPSFLLQLGPELCRTHLFHASSPLRNIVLGGEAFPSVKTLKDFIPSDSNSTIYNIYGITEVSCWSSLSNIKLDADLVDLGRPLSDTDWKVTDENGQEISQGEGILKIGGRRICLVDDETPSSIQKPFYRSTGDRVEILNGVLFYRGRTDFTVKRMGKRLNLHSVESIALQSGLLRQCCAFLDANKLLILVCTGINCPVDQLAQHFQLNASAIQRPDDIFVVESLPVSKHGKVDRQRIPEFVQSRRMQIQSSDWRICLKEEWTMATSGHKDIASDSNFIANGGNSLSALKLVSRLEDCIRQPVPLLLDILLNKNWQDVLDYLEHTTATNAGHSTTPVKVFQRCRPVEPSGDVLRAANGQLERIWKFDMKKCVDASPLVIQTLDGGTVFIGSHSHLFSAIDLESGVEKWTTELPERIESSACCDPTGMLIFVGCYDGHLYCLDSSNGRLRWQFATDDAIKSSPLCTGQSVIFGSHDRHLYSLSITDGQLLWKTRISDGSLFASPSCDGSSGRILAASLDGTCSALAVNSGNVLWTIKVAAPVFASPVWCPESDSFLLASVDGYLSKNRSDSGRQIWRFRTAGPIFSTPNVTDNRVVFGSHDHSLYCLNLDDGSPLWRVPFANPVYSSPFISNSSVVCCDTSGNLRVLDLSDGRLMTDIQLDGQVFSSPVLAGHFVAVGCRDDHLYCLQFNGQ